MEGIEDAFLERNYGNAGGNLYKPDSMSFGGGRGNGGGFDMDALMEDFDFSDMPERPAEGEGPQGRQNGGFPGGGMGSSDVKLQYVDDDPDSYPNIFDNPVFDDCHPGGPAAADCRFKKGTLTIRQQNLVTLSQPEHTNTMPRLFLRKLRIDGYIRRIKYLHLIYN